MNDTNVVKLQRRQFLFAASALGLAGPLFGHAGVANAADTAAPPGGGFPAIKLFNNPAFDSWLLRVLGFSVDGGSTIAELSYAASIIKGSSYADYVEALTTTGDIVRKKAEASLAAGHRGSARSAYQRATSYYRAAEYHAPAWSSEFVALHKQYDACFDKFLELQTTPFERKKFSSPAGPAEAYFWKAARDNKPRPTVVIIGGYDSSPEENFYLFGTGALERGYNAVVVEGPGHFTINAHTKLPFRPDFEVPTKPALDWISSRPDVAKDKLMLAGLSFGGHLVLRMAAHEPRYRAVIATSPITDWFEWGKLGMPPFVFDALKKPNPTNADIAALDARFAADPTLAWLGAWLRNKQGKPTMLETARSFGDYRISDRELRNIRAPLLGLTVKTEGPEAYRQAAYATKTVPNGTLHLFTDQEARYHCQMDNVPGMNAFAYDWAETALA